MQSFSEQIKKQQVNQNEVAVFWLGQAGFIFKTANGTLIGVDLYLSNCCERFFGFKRLMPYLLNPKDIEFDLIITTHAHYDHFDIDAIQTLLDNQKSELIATVDCLSECEKLGIDNKKITYIQRNDKLTKHDIEIHAMPCDHGELAPDAIGILLNIIGKRIYITGDTCYREDLFANGELKNCDLLILPINGAFGNLNEKESCDAAKLLTPKLTVPCHYWNFKEHGGNPNLFTENFDKVCLNMQCTIMRMGECIVLK